MTIEHSCTPTLSELREELERANTEIRTLREQAGALKADERKWLMAVFYDAMKWAGIGGLMRVKINQRVLDTIAQVEAKNSEAA